MRRIILLLVLLAMCLSCSKGNDKINSVLKGKEPVDVLVLIDGTGSSTKFLPDYQEGLQKMVKNLPAGTSLIIGWLNNNTEASFKPIISVHLPKSNIFADSELDVQDARKNIADSINTAIGTSIKNLQTASTSDIISSFRLVNSLMPENQHHRMLYIFSDMQQTGDPTLGNMTGINDAKIETWVGKLKEEGRLPALPNLHVYVAGAYNDDNTTYISYQKFWERFIGETGATLKYYGHAYHEPDFRN